MGSQLRRWILLVAGTAAVGSAFAAVGLPAAFLLGALVVGIVNALIARMSLAVPVTAMTLFQAIIGATIGNTVRASTLSVVASHWAPVLLSCAGTLCVSMFAGFMLARISRIDLGTAAFSMIAGGAVGIVSVSDSLGADGRVVAVIQYLRVMTIVALTPIVAASLFGASRTSDLVAAHGSSLLGLGLAAVSIVAGLATGKIARLPLASMLGPMIVAALLTVASGSLNPKIPLVVQDVGFAGIGLQIGLSFTVASLRRASAVLPAAMALIAMIVVLCGLFGIVLARLAHVTLLDGYLATTPGGIYAVLATAVSTNADTAFIMSVQVLRTIVMLLSAPAIAFALRRWKPLVHAANSVPAERSSRPG